MRRVEKVFCIIAAVSLVTFGQPYSIAGIAKIQRKRKFWSLMCAELLAGQVRIHVFNI